MTNSFSYNQGIPAAGNAPKNDQPLMQTNFSSISSLISVDHLGFNTANTAATNGGFHKVVHMTQFSNVSTNPPTNNPPNVPSQISNIGEAFVLQLNNIPGGGGTTDENFFFQSGGGRWYQLTTPTTGVGNQTSFSTVNVGGTNYYQGYTPLFGGIIMQFGAFQVTTAPTTVTFPFAFPNACMNVQVTYSILGAPSSSATGVYFRARNLTTTNFQLDFVGYQNNTAVFMYQALGF